MTQRTVADYIVAYLASIGVRHIFGYPGSPLVPLLAALGRQDKVKWVLMRHENAAALAAAASAKLTGELAVCCLTSGPGALQGVCGVADANLDRAPLLVLSGLVARSQQGHWDFQDVDQTSLYGAMLDQSFSCTSATQVVALLRKLTGYAIQQRAATHLALPVDVLSEAIREDDPHYALARGPRGFQLTSQPSDHDIAQCVQSIAGLKPVVVVGNRALGAGPAIERLAEALNAPIVASFEGKGIIDEGHPHYLGVLGIFGHPAVASTRAIVEDAGIVISFGVDNLKPFLSGARNAQERRLILCTPETSTVSFEYVADTILVGNLASIAERMRAKLPAVEKSGLVGELSTKRLETMMGILETLPEDHDPRYTNALDFLLQLNGHLDASHSIVVDTGSHALWVALYLRLRQRQRYVVSGRLGTMGFSIPAAIAMQLEEPGKKAIAICGDGGFGMVGMELATAVENRLPIVIVVINNGVLQNVMAQQKEPFGTKLLNPDFVQFAKAFGAEAETVDGESDADAIIRRALAHRGGPYLIDVRVSPSLLAPLNKWEAV